MEKPTAPRLVEITFPLPPRVVKKIDEYAKIAGWSRAELLSRLVCAEVDAIQFDALTFRQEAPKFEKTRKRRLGDNKRVGEKQ